MDLASTSIHWLQNADYLSAIDKVKMARYLFSLHMKMPAYKAQAHLSEVRAKKVIEKKYPELLGDVKVGIIPTHAIGPMAHYAELHLRYCRTQRLNPLKDIVFVTDTKIVNQQLLAMIKRVAQVRTDSHLYNTILLGGSNFLKQRGNYLPDLYKNGLIYYPESPQNLFLTEEELERGKNLLLKIGLKNADQPFVTIHNKDDYYYGTVKGQGKPLDTYRSSDFNRLRPLIEWLNGQGLAVIRSGHYADEMPLCYLSLNKLTQDEKEFMDIYIQYCCFFAICGASGIGWLPYLFKKNTLFHNYIPMGENPSFEHGILLPKLIRSQRTQETTTIRKLMTTTFPVFSQDRYYSTVEFVTADRFQSSDLYEKCKLEVLENSEEELLMAAQEIMQLSKAGLNLDDAEQNLQDKFRRSFPLGHPLRHHTGIISPHFLSKNPEILCQS